MGWELGPLALVTPKDEASVKVPWLGWDGMAGTKGHIFLPANPLSSLDTRSATREGWPCAGLLGALEEPLVGRLAKANQLICWSWKPSQTQLLIWNGIEVTGLFASPWVKGMSRGADVHYTWN